MNHGKKVGCIKAQTVVTFDRRLYHSFIGGVVVERLITVCNGPGWARACLIQVECNDMSELEDQCSEGASESKGKERDGAM